MLGSVYFIGEEGGCIKVGWTANDVSRRLHNLQIGNSRELALLAVIPGVPQTVEIDWHREFAYARHRGEWFFPLPELIRKIKEIAPVSNVQEPVVAKEREGSMASLADWLRMSRMSQREFADKLGVTDSTMSQIMCGRRKIGLGMATRIELATGGAVKAAVLLGLEAA